MIGTHFCHLYNQVVQLIQCSLGEWAVLALTHASFFGVVLPHLLLLGQEGLGACLWTAEPTA